MDNQTQQPNETDPAENPLLLWVAYLPGEGNDKHYLSNGKGGVRVFKTEDAILKHLRENLTPDVFERVVVHTVQGEIVVALEEGTQAPPDVIIPVQIPPVSIGTLARDSAPTATEIMKDYLLRRTAAERRKHNK